MNPITTTVPFHAVALPGSIKPGFEFIVVPYTEICCYCHLKINPNAQSLFWCSFCHLSTHASCYNREFTRNAYVPICPLCGKLTAADQTEWEKTCDEFMLKIQESITVDEEFQPLFSPIPTIFTPPNDNSN